ncbi:amino acid permease [Actinotalea ferrariae]|uniref:basic amino acid/polyamine antiporter n=1 Tax=Actinotalea ferrariae TaxID=1386098 RepID=UPI001EC3DC57|nr:basic amino acid/polyamine antiporter [Actinotalea ferrariae]MBX9243317.1 amino acid permease [Actinotalea ferrariae]
MSTQETSGAATSAPGTAPHRAVTLGVGTLTAMVVGSMVGAGVFSLPATFAGETGVLGALLAWAIAGTGMLLLALVFQSLALRKPELDAGVYAYARAGFGQYIGFFSAIGYWASACAGNVTYWILIMSTAGAVVPALGEGSTPLAFALSSVGVWVFFLLVRRGVKEAAGVNRVVTIAKLVPILVFVALALTVFDPAVFAGNLHGTADAGTLFEQVRGTMLITVFVFLGVEGASVYSRHATKRSDVGRATILGFLSVLAIFASVTIVSYGVMPLEEIAALRQPSMAGVLEAAVGPWGTVLVSVGLIVSVLGAYLAWSLMAAEVLMVAAKDGDMPRFLGRTNAADAPGPALLMSAVAVQLLLVVTLFSSDAFDFALDLTSALSLVPFLLAAGYALKLGVTGETYAGRSSVRTRQLVVAGLATLYTAFLIWAAGLGFLLLSFVIYAPATVLFAMARREQGRPVLVGRERVIFALSVLGAVAGVVCLATGAISL